LLHRLRERGVLRVAGSYAVIAWLLLQVADVTLDPLGLPKWVMTALIVAAVIGFPVAVALAWFLEIGAHGVRLDTAADGVPRPTARGIRHYADFIIIGALLVAVAVLLVRQSDLGKPKPPENPAIAVLPFENLSGDPEQEYFSDGLAEEMLDRLGRVPGLRVTARSSSFTFKGKDVDARTVAESLGVTSVLEGSVRRDGQRLKLNARLIDGATGQQTWSGSFDREVTDIFAVQAELAAAIVNAIIPTARGEAAIEVVAPTTDLSAYDLYLLARTQLAMRTDSGIQKSVDLMQQAVQLDPDFARAHAHLATSLLFLRIYNVDFAAPEQMDSWLRAAEASIHRALALDPNLSEAHGAYANLLRDTGRPGAEEQYQRALEANPNNAPVWHDYAVYLGNVADRSEESARATLRALELDPRQPVTWANYLGNLEAPGSEAFKREFERATRIVGDMPGALDRMTMPWASIDGFPVQIMVAGLAKQKANSGDNLPAWLNFARAWAFVDLERARQILANRNDVRHDVDYGRIAEVLHAEAAALMGRWDEWEQETRSLEQRYPPNDPSLVGFKAFWLMVQGRETDAVALGPVQPSEWRSGFPPMLANYSEFGASDTAQLRLLRASGRRDEADRMARDLLGKFREQRDAARGVECGDQPAWTQYASVAANEGLKDEAVAALRTALSCGDLPWGFLPQLPWFKALEGYAPYDALLEERARRIDKIRAELVRLEDGTG
jgi:TolB-like protein